MITRIWHGRTSRENADNYMNFLLKEGTSDYLKTPGNISAKVWRKDDTDETHFYTVTEWEDLKAIEAFAGPEYTRAVYYPEDQGILLEFEETVNHHKTFTVSNTRLKEYIVMMNRLLHGGGWIDECFDDKLKQVTEQDAFIIPKGANHSIASLLWHCCYWKKVAISYILDDNNYRDSTVEALNFLPLEELKAMGWKGLLKMFHDTHQTLIDLLSNSSDQILKEEYYPNCSFERLLDGIVQHDAYHLGQIGLILILLS